MRNKTSITGGKINSYFISDNSIFYMAYVEPEDKSIKENYSCYIIIKYGKN